MAALIALQAAVGHSMAWPNGARAAIALTYDDAAPSQLDHAIPALDAAGLKGTFFLSNVRQADVGRWKAAAISGHELANHTLNHPCLAGTFEMPLRQQLEQHRPSPMPAVRTMSQPRMSRVMRPSMGGRSMALPSPAARRSLAAKIIWSCCAGRNS